MAPLEAIRRLKYMYDMRRALKADDFRAVAQALGNYQEWYVGSHETKTSDYARREAGKFINSLRGKG